MSPHPLLVKRFIRFEMTIVVSLVVLGALYALGLWLNNSVLLFVLDPIISIISTVAFYGLFVVPLVWVLGKSIFAKASSRAHDIESDERLQRLSVETLHRMNVNPGGTRFVVQQRSSSASTLRWRRRDTIRVGDQLLQSATDGEIIGILGHECGHVLKRHLTFKAVRNVLLFFGFLAASYVADRSHPAAVLAVAGFLAVYLVEIPLNWRIEYSADKFSAEKLGPSLMVSALERLRALSPDCASFTHPSLSRRIRRIRSLSVTPLITHVYG